MLEIYRPPSKWYRRCKKISITIWPRWLAQLLCKHNDEIVITAKWKNNKRMFSHGQCPDCYKYIEFNKWYDLGEKVNIRKVKEE